MAAGAKRNLWHRDKDADLVAMNLFWFHAFRRATTREFVHVLGQEATTPPPGAGTRTQANETALGIEPSVYAYLGRTLETFGDAAVALVMKSNRGSVSPFDTGGLVAKILPICNWEPEERQRYLRAHTWPTEKLDELLQQYPGDAKLASYLNEERPAWSGPHEPLKCKEPVAAIWQLKENEHWRCWTWELRCTQKLLSGDYLVNWSCSVPLFQKFLDYQEQASDATEQELLEQLAAKYVQGGVTRLVFDLRSKQAER